jgi:hypothetical protein
VEPRIERSWGADIMNWYKKAKEREYPVAAVISAAGRLFEGRTHSDALQKALD